MLLCTSRAATEELKNLLIGFGDRSSLPPIDHFYLGSYTAKMPPPPRMLANTAQLMTDVAMRLTFLTVGSIEPNRGYEQLIAAFDLLWQQGADINLSLSERKSP